MSIDVQSNQSMSMMHVLECTTKMLDCTVSCSSVLHLSISMESHESEYCSSTGGLRIIGNAHHPGLKMLKSAREARALLCSVA